MSTVSTLRTLDRRQLLAGGGAALAAGAAVKIGVEAAIPACVALHERFADELGRAVKTTRLAGNNVLSAIQAIACPCCGEPLVKRD